MSSPHQTGVSASATVHIIEDDPCRSSPLVRPTIGGAILEPAPDTVDTESTRCGDFPVSFSWRRLNDDEQALHIKDGPVFWVDDDESSRSPAVGNILTFSHDPVFLGPVPEGASGFSVRLPASEEDTVLTCIVGVWHGTSRIRVDVGATELFEDSFTTASVAQYQRIVVQTAGKEVTITLELLMKSDTEGRAIFAGAIACPGEVVREEQPARYAFVTNPGLVTTFGWEGDRHAPIAHIDGSYQLRDNANQIVTFGMPDIAGQISWYNAEGYLPELVSEFEYQGMKVQIRNFADCVDHEGRKLEIAYSRVTCTNTGESSVEVPAPVVWRAGAQDAGHLVELSTHPERTLEPGETKIFDYAIGADRFAESYPWPSSEQMRAYGGFDQHRQHMRAYWDDRLSRITELRSLPDATLIDAYKAGFIYTLIVRDDIDGQKQLNVGENGYDRIFDHDVIGILSTLLTIGDFTYAKDYFDTLTSNPQYPDAKWKYSWPWAVYLLKTGDTRFVASNFPLIKSRTHEIHTDRDPDSGVMQASFAIDSLGHWTIDNWSALFGLITYGFVCDKLADNTGEQLYRDEAQWARDEYCSLFAATETMIRQTMDDNQIAYLPFSMTMANEDPRNERRNPHDANWASMLLFGRWGWDGYLFGVDDQSVMTTSIDETYRHGQKRREEIGADPANFGGYSHGYFCSSYNAGYGSTALRGEQFRDLGIRAYQFMIESAMSGPFSWWEGIDFPDSNSPWDRPHGAGGGGSSPHMWGQATATKVLVDSLIAEKADGTLLIARGVPSSWLRPEAPPIEVEHYPTSGGERAGFRLETKTRTLQLDLRGSAINADVILELAALPGVVTAISGGTYNPARKTAHIPGGIAQAIVHYDSDSDSSGQHIDNRREQVQ